MSISVRSIDKRRKNGEKSFDSRKRFAYERAAGVRTRVFARTLLAFAPYDSPGAVLSHSSPRHVYLRPVRVWWSYSPGLLRGAGANAAILPKM